MTSARIASLFAVLALAGCAAPGTDDTAQQSAAVSAPSVDDLMSKASGDTHSNVTPMGRYFERLVGTVPSSDERSFLRDASQSPELPPSVAGLHLETFTVDLYPNGRPVPADVNQHAIGDCSAAAVWASLAMQAPGYIESIIDDHGDGTFGVHVYDPSGRPFVIGVDSAFIARSPSQLEAVSGKAGVADWTTVLEKAAMKYLAVYPVTGKIGGIGSEFVAPIFTGSGDSFAFMPGRLTPTEMSRAVKGLLARGKLVIGGFNQKLTLEGRSTMTLHAYTLMVPPGQSMVSMRNPWGTSPLAAGGYDGSADGVIDIPQEATWSNAIDMRVIDPGHSFVSR